MMGGTRSLAVLLASGLIAGPALADPKPPTERDRKVASDLVKSAIAKSQAGDHAGAIKVYLQAYTLAPNSLLLSNIGAEFQQDGMYKEALEYFCKYLQEDPAGTNAPYAKSQARILQRQLGKKRVGDRDVCAPSRDDDPAEDTGRRTDTGRTEPGRNDIGRTDGGRPDAERADTGRSDAGRGSKTGRTDAGRTGTRRATDDPTAPIDRESTGNPTLMYVGLGVAGVGAIFAGVGLYDGYQAKKISDEISSHDPMMKWPDNIRDLERRGQDYENLEIVFLGLSGAAITAGVVLYVLGRPDGSHERGDKPSIGVAPTRHGVAVVGRF